MKGIETKKEEALKGVENENIVTKGKDNTHTNTQTNGANVITNTNTVSANNAKDSAKLTNKV